MHIARDLERRAASGNPIRVGVIGCGEMGTDLVTQIALMKGIEIGVLADHTLAKIHEALHIAGLSPSSARLCNSVAEAEAAIVDRVMAMTTEGEFACMAAGIDVVIDATGSPNVGAKLAILAMDHGKHVVMMNVEADVTVGAYFMRYAHEKGVIYSLAAGDEPTAVMELIRFAQSLGYPVIAAGKGKNNPLKIDAVPADYEEEARRRNMNARVLVEFVDGSKTMVEMVAIANATGLVPDVPGMHGPAATVEQLPKMLVPVEDGGILSKAGVVDYSVGKGVAPGVFAIVKAPHPRVDERMRDLKVGDGPYYALIRPFHLTSLETPLTAARIMLHGEADMQPLLTPVADVASMAKRDMEPGVVMGRIGQEHYRGFAVTRVYSLEHRLLPLGIAERAVVTKAVKAGELLTYDNCRPDETMHIVRLRRLQDEILAAEAALLPKKAKETV